MVLLLVGKRACNICLIWYDCIQNERYDSKQFYDKIRAKKRLKGVVKMPWEEKTVEKNRNDFVMECISGEKNMSELCRKYNITRKTGYKWFERFKTDQSLSDKSHRPFHTPNKTLDNIEQLILEARGAHPAWAARKLKRYLENNGETNLPAHSTISQILKRNNCIEIEESLKRKPYIRFERDKPNELWQVDFKGDFLMQNSDRCYPLTVLDDHSRYSLCVDAKSNQQGSGVFASFDRIFRENGLPETILSDNGNPWGHSSSGYTFFELWLMQLNILPIHGRPLHPQTQGKEERFHLTMVKELLSRKILIDIADAQINFDRWRYEYNFERPHDALKLDTPSKHYKPSKITMPAHLSEPEYDDNLFLRKVNCKGYLSINQHKYFISDVFVNKYFEINIEADDCVSLCYGNFKIAKIDLKEQLIVSKKIYRR